MDAGPLACTLLNKWDTPGSRLKAAESALIISWLNAGLDEVEAVPAATALLAEEGWAYCIGCPSDAAADENAVVVLAAL